MPINWGLLGSPERRSFGIDWRSLGFEEDSEELERAKRRKLAELQGLAGASSLMGGDRAEDLAEKREALTPGLQVSPIAERIGQRQAAELGIDQSRRNWADTALGVGEQFAREALDFPAAGIRQDEWLRKKEEGDLSVGSFAAKVARTLPPFVGQRVLGAAADVAGLRDEAIRNPEETERAMVETIANAPHAGVAEALSRVSRAAGMVTDPLASIGAAASVGRRVAKRAMIEKPPVEMTSRWLSHEGGLPENLHELLQGAQKAGQGGDFDAARLSDEIERGIQKEIDTALALEAPERKAELDDLIHRALAGKLPDSPPSAALVPHGLLVTEAFDKLPARLKAPVKALRDRIDAGAHKITTAALFSDDAANAFQDLVQQTGESDKVVQFFADRKAMREGANAAAEIMDDPMSFFRLRGEAFDEALKNIEDATLRTKFREAHDGMWRTADFLKRHSAKPQVAKAVQYLDQHLQKLAPHRQATAEHYIPVLAKVESKMGTYLHTSHVAFDDPKYAKTLAAHPEAERFQNFVRYGVEQENMAPEQATAWAKRILGDLEKRQFEQDASWKLFPEIPGADMGPLKKKTNLPRPVAEFLGEHQDWRIRAQRSIVHQAEIAAEIKMWDDLAETAGPNVFRLGPVDRAAVNDLGHSLSYPVTKGSRMIAPEGQAFFTYPEIGKALDAGNQAASKFWEFLRNTNAAVKSGLVVFNPASRAPNYAADFLLAMKSGHPEAVPFFMGETHRLKGQEVSRIKGRIPAQESREMAAFHSELAKRGVMTSGGAMQDSRQHLGALLGQPAKGVRGVLSPGYEEMLGVSSLGTKARDKMLGWAGKRLDLASARFGAPDQAIRSAHAKYRAQDLAKAYPSWSNAQILDEASRRAMNEIPTPENSPKIIQEIRRDAPFAPFVTFPAEMARTAVNSFRYAAGDLRKALFSSDAELAKEGASRAGLWELGTRGLTGTIASIFVLTPIIAGAKLALNQAFPGLNDKETQEARRRFMPEYYKNNNFTSLGEDSRYTYLMDWTPLDAYGNFQKAATAALGAIYEGEGPFNAAMAALEEASQPLTDPQPLAQAAVSASTGRDRGGEGARLTNPEKDFSDQASDVSSKLLKQIQPGFLRSAGKGMEAMKTGDAWLAAREVASWFGLRMYRYDKKENVVQTARERSRRYNDLMGLRTEAVNKFLKEPVLPLVLEAEQEAQQKWATDLSKEVEKDIAAARKMGMTDAEIIRLFSSEGNFSKKHLEAIMRGQLLPLSWKK